MRPPGLTDLFIALAYLGFLATNLTTLTVDPGVGWHLKTGEHVLSSGPLWEDPFLIPVRAWVSDQWIGDLVLFLVFKIGNWELLYGLSTLIFLLVPFVLVAKSVSYSGVSPVSSALISFLTFKAIMVQANLRPAMFGIAFFALVCFFISRVRGNKENKPLPIYLPLVFLLWANVHPSFVLGLLLVAFLWLDKLLVKRSFSVRLMLIGVVCFACTFLNPYGINLHLSILELGASDYFMNLHSEWQSPNFAIDEGRIIEIACGLIFLALICGKELQKRCSFYELAIFLFFAHSTLQAIRFLPFLLIASAPMVAISLDILARRLGAGRLATTAVAMKRINEREARSAMGMYSIGVIVVLAVLSPFLGVVGYEGKYGVEHLYPKKAIQAIEADAQTDDRIVMTYPEWGGYLAFSSTLKPLIDDRNTLLGEEFSRQYHENFRYSGEWLALAESLNADYILIRREDPLHLAFTASRNVQELYADDQARAYRFQAPHKLLQE